MDHRCIDLVAQLTSHVQESLLAGGEVQHRRLGVALAGGGVLGQEGHEQIEVTPVLGGPPRSQPLCPAPDARKVGLHVIDRVTIRAMVEHQRAPPIPAERRQGGLVAPRSREGRVDHRCIDLVAQLTSHVQESLLAGGEVQHRRLGVALAGGGVLGQEGHEQIEVTPVLGGPPRSQPLCPAPDARKVGLHVIDRVTIRAMVEHQRAPPGQAVLVRQVNHVGERRRPVDVGARNELVAPPQPCAELGCLPIDGGQYSEGGKEGEGVLALEAAELDGHRRSPGPVVVGTEPRDSATSALGVARPSPCSVSHSLRRWSARRRIASSHAMRCQP